jgi:hypothetical protein
MLKVLGAALGALGAGAAVAAVAMAQTGPPVVAVTASPTSVAAQVTAPVAAGPTTFRISRAASRTGLSVYIATLNAGVTLPELQAAIRRDDRTQGNGGSLGLATVHASVTFEARTVTSRDVTFTTRPGLTYFMLSEPDAENGPPPSRGFGSFTTSGQANGAAAPAPDATVRMEDLRFRGSATLPRRGTVRVQNFGAGPHIAIAFPLRPGVSNAAAGRAIRSDSDAAFGRIVGGTPTALQTILSGGGQSDDQQVSFARTGRYALVCFFNEHNKLGMYRIVTVR